MKYTTVTISGIITQIAKTTDVKGYTLGLLEAFLPDENEMQKWTKKDTELWIEDNNKRMESICELLNSKEIKQTKEELLDCIHNLMAVIDTPLGRRQIKGDFADDARAIGKKIMEDNNRSLFVG